MFGAMVPTENSETPNRIRVRQLTDKLSMLQDELDNEKMVSPWTQPHPAENLSRVI